MCESYVKPFTTIMGVYFEGKHVNPFTSGGYFCKLVCASYINPFTMIMDAYFEGKHVNPFTSHFCAKFLPACTTLSNHLLRQWVPISSDVASCIKPFTSHFCKHACVSYINPFTNHFCRHACASYIKPFTMTMG